jgi:hypothetical protein
MGARASGAVAGGGLTLLQTDEGSLEPLELAENTVTEAEALHFMNLIHSASSAPSLTKAASSPSLNVPPSPTSAADAKALPVDAHRRSIIHAIENHSVTVIRGETGCGKSRYQQSHADEGSTIQRTP